MTHRNLPTIDKKLQVNILSAVYNVADKQIRSVPVLKKIAILVFFMTGVSLITLGQNTNHYLKIKKTQSKIIVDGQLTEIAWAESEMVSNFWEKWPKDDNHPKYQTEVRATYDDIYLYFSAICYDSGNHVIQSLKRDTRFWDSDGFSVILDPIRQKTNGYVFGVSPENAQAETLIGTNGGFGDFTWDTKWLSAVTKLNDKWIVEIAIPFRSLSFKEGLTEWGINFMRNDIKNNRYHSWMRIPVQLYGNDLAYLATLQWDSPPKKKSGSVQLLPYVTMAGNHESGSTTGDVNAGLDSKIAISSSLNMDVTINPDFSQVEVDQQQVNLTRFDLFFPEKRQFFVENSDLFSSFGNGVINPLYTRAIGLDKNGNSIPLLGGVRLNGNVNKNLRISLMDMQTKTVSDSLSNNYAAFAFNQKVLKRSAVKAYFSNVENIISGSLSNTYQRNAGAEFAYYSENGKFSGWLSGHHSFRDKQGDDNNFFRAGGLYNSPTWTASVEGMQLGTKYFAGMGFLQRSENYDAIRDTTIRTGFKSFYAKVGYSFRKLKSRRINIFESIAESVNVWNPDGSLNEQQLKYTGTLYLKNTASFSVSLNDQHTQLVFPFKFTHKEPLPSGMYHYTLWGAAYKSDDRKKIRLNMSVNSGGFYNGTIRQYTAGIIFRHQPHVNISANIERHELSFPENIGESNRVLFNSRIEYFFTTKLNWTCFFQYNTQSNNVNINSRIQWRYRPMSDVFLVYTDNYFSDPLFKNKNHAVVLKLNYWFNL